MLATIIFDKKIYIIDQKIAKMILKYGNNKKIFFLKKSTLYNKKNGILFPNSNISKNIHIN